MSQLFIKDVCCISNYLATVAERIWKLLHIYEHFVDSRASQVLPVLNQPITMRQQSSTTVTSQDGMKL